MRQAVGRDGRRAGGMLFAAVLLRCSSPRWVFVRPQPLERRIAWGAEAIAVCRAAVACERPGAAELLARALVLQAGLLLDSRRYEEALAAAEESLKVPDAHISSAQEAYGLLMCTLALGHLDRTDEALVTTRDTVDAYRYAKPRRADRSMGSMAWALRADAWVLGRSGRTAESVEVYLHCVDLLRKLSLWQQAFRSHVLYCRVLAELTGGLRALGRFEEAVEAGSDARERVGALVPWLYPEAQAMRAGLLVDLAWCHYATDDLPRARSTAEEAVARCRMVRGSDPAVGDPLLALALDGLAHFLGRLGSHVEERAACEELVGLYEVLAANAPDAHEPGLADALDRLALCQTRDGENAASVAATERCVERYRRAAGREPLLHEPELARTLANLCVRQSGIRAFDGAVASGAEALELTRRLAEADGETYRTLVADRLRILGRARYRVEDDEGAAAGFEEAESLLRELMEEVPGTYEKGLAAAQSELALALGAAVDSHLDAGRTDDAVTALRRIRALTGRSALTDVHAACVNAFARARDRDAEGTGRIWSRETGEPWPSFVYRLG
ncbi:hypothetical protein [Streptomyces sp. NPDC096323]|uniref:hypothetical protein n=1 Tax=Streptomyces sp. NPDC096323 TaxID=3155822 RepID=UPI0033225877